MKPRRIQRKRTKDWRMPKNTVYVGRPTIYQNPFLGPNAFRWFRQWLSIDGQIHWDIFATIPVALLRYQPSPGTRRELLKDIERLKGKNLACWCPLDKPCHADVLLEIANP